jgi:hypothetical protein
MELSSDPQFIVYLASILLALLFDLVPPAKAWFDKRPPAAKRWGMVGAIALIVGGAFGLSCLGTIAWFTCGTSGIVPAVSLFVLAVLANQGVHGVVAKYQRDRAEAESVG